MSQQSQSVQSTSTTVISTPGSNLETSRRMLTGPEAAFKEIQMAHRIQRETLALWHQDDKDRSGP